MEQNHLLIKNTFLEVDEKDSEDSLPRAFSDQSHARKRVEYVITPGSTFASIPEESTESLSDRMSRSDSTAAILGEDSVVEELKSLRTYSNPIGQGYSDMPMYNPQLPVITSPVFNIPHPNRVHLVGDYQWHLESKQMGTISFDGKGFVKQHYGGRLSMVTESTVHKTGAQNYMIYIDKGPISVADGFGFVFSDILPCKKNIQKIDSIFVSKKGKVCSRIHNEMTVLNTHSIGDIDVGSVVELIVDLDDLQVTFSIYQCPKGIDMESLSILVRDELCVSHWLVGRAGPYSIEDLVTKTENGKAGYFCAVLKNLETTVRFI